MIRLCFGSALACVVTGQAFAGVGIEFNAQEALENSCKLSIVVTASADIELASLAYEAAIFDKNGLLVRQARLDLGAVPSGSTRLRQVALPMACEALGEVVLGPVLACEGQDFAVCASAQITSRLWDIVPLENEISLELNRLDQDETACRLTFLTRNGTETALGDLPAETVFFDTSGMVAALSIFDLGDVAAGQTRVRRYSLPAQECGALGKVLLNGTGLDTLPRFMTKTQLDILQ